MSYDFLSVGQKLWDVWSTRILITLAIMAALDFWQKRKHQPQPSSHRLGSGGAAQVLKYKPQENGATAATPQNPSNPLLERLDHQRQNQNQQQQDQPIRPVHPRVDDDDDDGGGGGGDDGDDDGGDDDDASDNDTPKNPASSKAKSTSQPLVPRTLPPPSAASTTTTNSRRPISAQTNHHPGMEGFGYWYETETSLYRIYTLGRHDGVQVVPPYIPHSYRGQVPINLHVTNKTNTVVSVYWVDYKGKHIRKGTLKPNHVWTQQTWVDHPWVFEGLDANDNPTPYLYYVPFRVIPTLSECPTVSPDDPDVGLHQFALVPAKTNTPFHVEVQDDVLPFPAIVHFTTPQQAITWTLQHMSRLSWSWNNHASAIQLLQKYLTNIVQHPEIPKYRQIRIGSPKFGTVWNSPLRGLLLAVGFVEVQGYAELGCCDKPFPRERIQELALLSYLLTQWQTNEQRRATTTSLQEQPEGADGFGRAGFGRIGSMN